MDFELPAEHGTITAAVRRFVAAEIAPVIAAYEASGEFPYPVIRRMGEAGLFGAVFPEALGGTAAGFFAVAAIAEELSRLAPEFGYAMNQQAMTCPFTIFNWGSDAQARRFVPDLIGGRKIGMFALTEPGGGSDAAGAMQTIARKRGDVYRVDGAKQWITFADACDAGLLFARTDPAAGHRGISAFVIEPKHARGYTATPIPMSGLSACLRSCAVFLDDFEVPAENRLGAEGDGFRIAMNALEYGRLTVAARLTGLAQACLEHAVAYARQRVIRGRPLAEYQMIQQLIADLSVNVPAARALTWRAAWTMQTGRRSTRAAAQAKYFAGRVAKHAAQAAAEIFAGYALADEYPIKKIAAYVNMLTVGEGTPNVQRILLAEDALGIKPADRHPVRNRAAPPGPEPDAAYL
jgi:alkylation response protein AidB-like acyl-CoA dehydrogenase